jgi:hypothetical protein
MKNLYLLGLMGIGIVAQAQTTRYPAVKADKAQPSVNMRHVDYAAPSPVVNSNNKPSTPGYNKSAGWITVGQTNFDRQTNSSVYRRIKAFTGGKVSVNWTTSSDGSLNNFLGRGSGYNHFNGTSWGPITTLRIEQSRTGYPCYDYNGTTEIIMSHKVDTAGKSGGLSYNTNGAIGSTTWSETAVLTPAANKPSVLWPRIATSGNYMHVVATYTSPTAGQDTVWVSGVKSPTVYSRYNFATSTWEVSNITLPGYDSVRWYNGDADGYAMDVNGSTVAIMMGGTTSDITLWKSTDNGTNWTHTIIDSFPVPAFNDQVVILDTPSVCDGSMALRLDASGKAHCFWGRLRVLNSTAGDNSFSVFLGTNSIDYWYEGRPDSIVSIAGALDLNNSGSLDLGAFDDRNRYGNAGVATMPYCVRNTNGDLIMVYSALTEDDTDPQGSNFRDVLVTFSKDNGATWSSAKNLTDIMGFNKEQMFASADIDDTNLHLTFMESDAVGFWSSDNNASKTGPFDIRYYKVPVADIFADSAIVGTGVKTVNNLFTVSANYPNPFHNATIIPVNLTAKADVKITVMNILGEEIYSNTFTNTTTGVNRLEVNSNFTSGFYFYNVEAGGFKTSGKMLAE